MNPMQKVLAKVLLLVSTILATAVSLGAAPVKHVVLVSIDGLRPEFYLDSTWPAPTIQQMAREGAHAKRVRGVFPTVTYPSHTTIVTGALPIRHGIYYNEPFEPEGQTGRWYWEESSIRVPTLWDAVHQAGLESAALSWPVTVGAPIDHNVPEVWSLNRDATPLQEMRSKSTPAGLFEEIELEATGRLGQGNFGSDYLTRDDRAGAAAAYLLEKYKPALLAVHLVQADHFQHQAGREGAIVSRAVATVDRAIGQIWDAAQRAGILNETAFVITGDHGFVEDNARLAPNVWLAQAGLLQPQRDRGNWRAAFHSQGGSAFLHLRDAGDKAAVDQVRRLLAEVPSRYRKLFRVVERDELDRIGADPDVPLALAAIEGIGFLSAADGDVLRSWKGGSHGYDPQIRNVQTGFIGWGPGFRPGARVPVMGLEDIAPLIAKLLDLPFEAPDGALIPGILEKSN